MKTYISLLMISLFCISCNAQNNETKQELKAKPNSLMEQPKGSWKVDKEFDENGNLIRYDSIYSWSSSSNLDDLSTFEKDSLLKSFEDRFFKNFSNFKDQGFEDIFSSDSVFSKRFFNDDFFGSNFGNDLMDIDKIRQRMLERQKQFLEKYQSEFIKPENDN